MLFAVNRKAYLRRPSLVGDAIQNTLNATFGDNPLTGIVLKELPGILRRLGQLVRISRIPLLLELRKVRQFDFSVSGALRIEMEDGTEAWASRRFIPIIKKRLQRKDR